ncbi:MAG TPA: AAA family ATPase [Smithellaceae bacterium]|nr:AAA family ATPase [Smithellaceae bacterium]HRS90153.1 AAA family ATPase [Smithellaceae bacterium]HRV26952.1 AAA family ATPase [Smithellaceae bacterium]
MKDAEAEDKYWLINFLKKPATKIIWIADNIEDIDAAVLRHFSFSLEFKQINRRQRIGAWKSILNKHRLKNRFSDEELEELSKYPVNTDIIDRCVKTAIEIALPEKSNLKEIVRKNVEAQMELIKNKPNNKDKIENNYSLEGLNVEGDLPTIMCQLEAFDKYLLDSDKSLNRNFNLLFYGPPGTGKSELARYIGKQLEREIMCKRASDIVSPYVGETEQNLNKVFRQAEQEETILIIDEADSFLYKREWATRSWEISQTNEFLTQMERFRGILICTTNMLQGLDSASIRRFNHKIKFDYLKPDGNVIFYLRLLASMASNPMDETDEDKLRKIKQLTPGDFRVVRDRYSFYKPRDLSHPLLVESLSKEANIKQFQRDGDKRIGF